ncbi:GNAT family N-acetyltransferase [Hoeflea sp. YIM 152468]|uniref:GNAT family N-acetyltransferase n=1 Tax=Hoeflea sp. YIM 152468 TaxID=3031759 RepID=UPI0023DC2CA9|nr:GNAT family N-acetyltransferase [Hoeflea sp. YIM 152468]MDF1609597.1 GNAT family N-acetyltransferase [Hoeflea sp. YIM 152468]
MSAFRIRQSRPNDIPAFDSLYSAAFPDEDLLPLVRQLLGQDSGILSLVAEAEAALAGHILFTSCGISGSDTSAALLAPLAVAPDWQRQGIGTGLIREGLTQLRSAGISQVYVLGDPAYYRRSGFKTGTGVAPPYPLPEQWRDAWQSLSLGSIPSPAEGRLLLPEPWLQPALWSP